MKAFDYLAVLLSIVLGLGVAQLLSGFARWLELRMRVWPYLPAMAWAGFLLVAHVQTWWSMFGLRGYEGWTFLQFWVVLNQPLLLYLLAALVLPSANSPEPDLRTNFLANREWFFGLFLGLLAESVGKDVVLTGRLPAPENLGFHGALAVLGVVGFNAKSDRVQRLVAVAALAVLAAYVTLLFATLA